MNMSNFLESRKGVSTIAEVMMVLVGTMGAGAVYDGSTGVQDVDQNLTGNITEEEAEGLLSSFQKAVDNLVKEVGTEVSIYRMESNRTSIAEGEHTVENYGTIHASIHNVGETEANTTEFRMTVLTGEEMDGNCFTEENSTLLAPGETYYCDTGITFPRATNEVKVKILLKGSAKDRFYTCRPELVGDTIC